MVPISQPAAEDYPADFAGYVAEIGEDQDVLAVLADQLDVADTERVFALRAPITVRALAYVIAGHTRHHLRVLEGRYLR